MKVGDAVRMMRWLGAEDLDDKGNRREWFSDCRPKIRRIDHQHALLQMNKHFTLASVPLRDLEARAE